MNKEDSIKLEEFLKIIPKERIIKFFEYLEEHIYPIELFTGYDEYNGGLLTTFKNENINNAFKRFDVAFCAVKSHLLKIVQRTQIKEPEEKLFGYFEQGSQQLWELVDVLKREYANFTDTADRELLRVNLGDAVSNVKYKDDILFFQNKEINFNNKQNQKDLLKTLFKDPKKNWSYDEIQEDWDEAGIDKVKFPKDFWRKFYSAGDDIGKAVVIKTGVEDFIIKNTKEIKINPKYI